jgi:hypothetical protein
MARMIGDFTLAALRGADQRAGREPRRSFGSATGPIVRFVHKRLMRICQHTGEKPPTPETLREVLRRRSQGG